MKKIYLFFVFFASIATPFFWDISFYLFNGGDEQEKLISVIIFAGGCLLVAIGIALLSDQEKHFPTKRKIYLLGLILGITSFVLSHSYIPCLGL